uniref:Mos1 transposase HTH domain-containing protein n=1 Tax=Pipistrellus kuhlii TaxID=59472 RepID=A0A7J7ZJ26_PIPKU|nr:hypothetical protein mPipKuh1_009476 [Pipistrellus kuhlii]
MQRDRRISLNKSCGPRLTRGRLDDEGLQFAQDTEMPEGRRDERPLPSRAAGASAGPAMDETAGAFLYERESGTRSPTPHRTPTYLHRFNLNGTHAPDDRKLGTSAFRAAASHRPAPRRVALWEPNQKIQRRGLLKLNADALPVFGACRPGSLAPPTSEAEVEERGRVLVEVGTPAAAVRCFNPTGGGDQRILPPGKNASQAHKKLCAVYGDEALKEWQCQNWFAKFRSGDFSLKDEKRSGRPVEVDDALI